MLTRLFSILMLVLIITSVCNQKGQKCTIREWRILDLYRNAYPNIKDTICNSDSLFNGVILPKGIIDSIYFNFDKTYLVKGLGLFEVLATKDIDFKSVKYKCSKIRFLRPGYNMDQEFLFWIGNTEVLIQQENDSKKLFLLESIYQDGVSSHKRELVDKIIIDTVLFPTAPKLK